MKNVKKLLKKAMVWAIAASMVVATPLTASAAGLRGVFSVSDGWNETESGTGTVTNTNTNTTTLKKYEARIIGIALDKSHIDAVKDEPETLTATIIVDGFDDDADKALAVKALTDKLQWKVYNSDGKEIDGRTNTILNVDAKGGSKNIATLNPRKGTKSGDMVVKAYIDGKQTYTYTDKDGNQQTFTESTTSYEASATVSIKEYAAAIDFDDVEEQYEKHTLDMNDYLHFYSDAAKKVNIDDVCTDNVTWSIQTGVKNAATISDAGVVTIKKYDKNKSDAENTATVTAVTEQGKKATVSFEIKKGVKADKLLIFKADDATMDQAASYKKDTVDMGTSEPTTQVDVKAVMYVKDGGSFVTSAGITDKVEWSSNKPGIVSVKADGENATLEILAPGKATITAKATNGKKATLAVTVKATLSELSIEQVDDTVWSGQTYQMVAERDPEENNEGLKWSIDKVQKGDRWVANPNASINGKGVLTVKSTIDTAYPDVVVRVTSKTSKVPEGSTHEKDSKGFFTATATVSVGQSSIKRIDVKDVETNTIVAKVSVDDNKYKVTGAANTSKLSVPKGKVFTATVDDDAKGGSASLKWTTSNAKVASIAPGNGGTAMITANAKGKAKITVSGINVKSNGKGAVVKTTFTVDVKQPATSIKLNKTDIVIYPKTGNKTAQNVALKSTQNPKGAADNVIWTYERTKSAEGSVDGNKVTSSGKNNVNGKLELANAQAGEVYKVTATTVTGASATATVRVLQKPTAVEIHDGVNGSTFSEVNGTRTIKNTKYVELGEPFTMYPEINVGTKNDPQWKTADGKTVENVVYTQSGKGKVIIIGNVVYGVKEGKVTITAKTPNNKKTTLKVEVQPAK